VKERSRVDGSVSFFAFIAKERSGVDGSVSFFAFIVKERSGVDGSVSFFASESIVKERKKVTVRCDVGSRV